MNPNSFDAEVNATALCLLKTGHHVKMPGGQSGDSQHWVTRRQRARRCNKAAACDETPGSTALGATSAAPRWAEKATACGAAPAGEAPGAKSVARKGVEKAAARGAKPNGVAPGARLAARRDAGNAAARAVDLVEGKAVLRQPGGSLSGTE